MIGPEGGVAVAWKVCVPKDTSMDKVPSAALAKSPRRKVWTGMRAMGFRCGFHTCGNADGNGRV